MTENKSLDTNFNEVVIDVRALIKTLWEKKWIIIGAILLAALSAYFVSQFILPPKFETSSHIGIRRETFYANFEPSIENTYGLDDYRNLSDLTKSLPQMAEAEDIMLTVCEEMGLSCTGENSDRPEIDATLLGANQLKMTVACELPQRCTDFANLWAGEVIKRWNTLYGNESIDLDQLVLEVEDAQVIWVEAQASLEAYLPMSTINVVKVQLERAKEELSFSLLEIEENNSIIRDAATLDARLTNLAGDNELSLGDALSLIALQQRTTGEISGTQFQLPEEALLGQGYSVAAARESIGFLMISLAEENFDIEETLPTLESKINDLALALENEGYKVDQLTQERDRAKGTYQAMARHLDEETLNLRYQGKSAYILAQARLPELESGPSTALIMFASAIAAGVLAVGVVLLHRWWTED